MRSDKRRKMNVLEMKCLRSLVGVSRMDRVKPRPHEDFSRKVGLPAVERCSSVRKTIKQSVCRHVGCWILYSPTALPEIVSRDIASVR